MVISKWNDVELCRQDVPADSPIDIKDSEIAESHTADGQRAFTFRKIPPRKGFGLYRDDEDPLRCTIEIESQPLLDLMNSCMDCDYNLKSTINSPFRWLVWSWDALQASTKSEEEKDSEEMRLARIDLQELLKVLSTRTGVEPLDAYFAKRSTYEAEKSITHEALWTIFPPGTVVCASIVLKEPQLFFVTGAASSFPTPENREKDFSITCSCLDWDGRRFKLIPCELRIEYFKDKQNISALAVCPLKYHENEKGLRDLLIERGRKYEAYCTADQGKQMFRYNGPIIYQRAGHIFQASDEDENETTSNWSARLGGQTSIGPSEVRVTHKSGVIRSH